MTALEYKEEGNKFFKEGQWEKAIAQYTKGLGLETEDPKQEKLPADVRGLLLSNRSQCRLNVKEWQAALDDADECLKLIPSHTKSMFRRATAYENLGKKNEAFADYMRVAKAEPKNTVAVEKARTLRDDVMGSTQAKRDEILPAPLVDTLRKDNATLDEKKDACSKLRALCVHKSLGRAIAQAGVLDVLVKIVHNAETDKELRASSLGVLSVMASGYQAKEEDDDGVRTPMPPPNPDKPLEVAENVTAARGRLKDMLELEKLRQLCHSHDAAMRHLALMIGHTHSPEDGDALQVLNDAMLFVEGGELDVPRAGRLAVVGET
jgi:tetratricopeptide (TPR) repeat protein